MAFDGIALPSEIKASPGQPRGIGLHPNGWSSFLASGTKSAMAANCCTDGPGHLLPSTVLMSVASHTRFIICWLFISGAEENSPLALESSSGLGTRVGYSILG